MPINSSIKRSFLKEELQGADHLRHRSSWSRPPLRHRCDQDQPWARLETGWDLWDRHSQNRPVVPR